jgi:hypothetical protein
VLALKKFVIADVTLLVAGVTVCNALPRNMQYIVSVEAVAADSVKAVPEAVYALPDPGCCLTLLTNKAISFSLATA